MYVCLSAIVAEVLNMQIYPPILLFTKENCHQARLFRFLCNLKKIIINYVFFFFVGDGLKSPSDGKKSRSHPRVTCQQEDADSCFNQ